MFLNLNFLGQKIKSFKILLHVLLKFKNPTDNLVVICSQHLDQYIVEYQKLNIKDKKNKHIA